MSRRSFLLDDRVWSYVVDHTEPVDPVLARIVADNTLWSGRVPDPEADDDDTKALRAYNDRAHDDDRVDTVLLALADGLTVSQKR